MKPFKIQLFGGKDPASYDGAVKGIKKIRQGEQARKSMQADGTDEKAEAEGSTLAAGSTT